MDLKTCLSHSGGVNISTSLSEPQSLQERAEDMNLSLTIYWDI